MIIRTAAVAAPERVGWLATEGQTAARPVRFSFLRNNPLAGIAEAAAAADPASSSSAIPNWRGSGTSVSVTDIAFHVIVQPKHLRRKNQRRYAEVVRSAVA